MAITYDTSTEHGIGYISRLYSQNFEYKMIVNNLDGLSVVIQEFASGKGTVTSYSLGTRSVSRQVSSLSEARVWWDDLMRRKKLLEQGRRPRKAIGAVPMDW